MSRQHQFKKSQSPIHVSLVSSDDDTENSRLDKAGNDDDDDDDEEVFIVNSQDTTQTQSISLQTLEYVPSQECYTRCSEKIQVSTKIAKPMNLINEKREVLRKEKAKAKQSVILSYRDKDIRHQTRIEMRQTKEADRLLQKAITKDLNDVKKLNDDYRSGKYKHMEMRVYFHPTIFSADGSNKLIEALKEESFVIATHSLAVPNSITWARIRVEDDSLRKHHLNDLGVLELSSQSNAHEEPLDMIMLRHSAEEFQNMCANQTLISQLEQVLALNQVKRVVVVVENLERSIRSMQSARLRQSCRSDNDKIAPIHGLQSRDAIDELAANLIIMFHGRVHLKLCATLNDTATFLKHVTMAFVKGWYKRKVGLLHFAKTKKLMKAKSIGDTKEWFKYLVQFDGCSENRAEVLVAKYPNFSSLFNAYKSCSDNDERCKLLQDLQINNRRFGFKLSNNIFQRIWAL